MSKRGATQWLAAAALSMATMGQTAEAQSIDALMGTMEVEHQRQQSHGVLEGCSMVFRASFLDHAYRAGQPALVAGNFSFYVSGPQSAYITVKAGIKDMAPSEKAVEAPEFVYLQSAHGTTAKAKAVASDSDTPGFRMWVMPATVEAVGVLGDAISGGPITLGFTRQGGKLDVLVRLDLSVVATEISTDGTVTRRRSLEAVRSFGDCFSELAKKLKR